MAGRFPACKIGRSNLEWMFKQADDVDTREGQRAYQKYRVMMKAYSDEYRQPLDLVTAAFCALSPNNDYVGNLRSLTSVLEGLAAGVAGDSIVISTYNHCRDRAIDYLTGDAQFVAPSRGLKILSFYRNILNPDCAEHVTIDGHIAAAFCGDPKLIMKDVIISRKEYRRIARHVGELGVEYCLIPNQIQAIIWFARKRLYKIKYTPPGLFADPNDQWQILMPLDILTAYPRKASA